MASTPNDSKKSPESSTGEEHLRRLLGRQAPRLPIVSEPQAAPIGEDLPLPPRPKSSRDSAPAARPPTPSEELDEIAAFNEATNGGSKELEEEMRQMAKDFGF